LNREADARGTADSLQTQFDEHVYKFRTVQFWIAEVRLGGQDLDDEIRTGRSPLDDFDVKILVILDKFLFKSTRSIAKTLCIAHSIILLYLHDSIDFRLFHLH
jgi:hypothetical protein